MSREPVEDSRMRHAIIAGIVIVAMAFIALLDGALILTYEHRLDYRTTCKAAGGHIAPTIHDDTCITADGRIYE